MTGRFEIDYRYAARGSFGSKERYPIMVAWTTAPQAAKHAAAFHRHALSSASSGVIRVSFPFDREQVWPHDTTVRFLLMTALQSSEGQWTYAKTASTQAYLADLVKAAQKRDVSDTGKKDFHRIPMEIQSYYMPTPGQDDEDLVNAERHKGDLYVRLAPTPANQHLVGDAIRWADPDPLDITPANEAALQSAMMLTVKRSMSPFHSEESKPHLRPTLPEIHNVHAPLYVQETQIPLDGSSFWARVPDVARQHVHHHGGTREANEYLEVLLKQSLARHNMSESWFTKVGAAFQGKGRVSDTHIHRAVRVLASACTMRGNAMRYAADKAILSKSKRAVVVESFDQVDIRTGLASDTGGVLSRELHRPATLHAAKRFVNHGDEDRFMATGGSMDCEDAARDAAVHFVLIADPDAGISNAKLRSPLLKAARSIAQHYRAVGVLTSVRSRNLADARGGSSSSEQSNTEREEDTSPPIGSRRDREVEVGAHMFTLLVPQRVLEGNVHRALKNQGAKDIHVDLGTQSSTSSGPSGVTMVSRRGYPKIPSGSPLLHDRELPVALCEGTGILDPLMLAREHYVQSVQGKADAAMSVVLEQEGEVRMRTGKTSDELAKISAEIQTRMEEAAARARRQSKRGSSTVVRVEVDLPDSVRNANPPPSILDKFTSMHHQEWLMDHPDKRIVPSFYRTAAELYLVPTSVQLEARRRQRQDDTGINTLAGDRMIPLQVGARSKTVLSNGSATWGVAVSDILRQRSFVGFLPTPAPSGLETRIVDRVHSHVAPAVSLHLDTDLGHDKYVQAALRWQRQLNSPSYSGMPKIHLTLKRLESRGNVHRRYVLVHGYAHPKDLRNESVRELGDWMRDKNSHVVAAEFHVERFTYRLAMLRLDALVDCGAETVNRAKPRIRAMFYNRAVGQKGMLRRWQRPQLSGCSLPHHGDFVPIMEKHIQLTVDYVIKSWKHRFHQDPLPLNDPSVTALIQQFADWGRAIDGRATAKGREVFRAVWRELTDKMYAVEPSPGSLWVKDLIRDHTVFAKQLADAAWYPNVPDQVVRKKKALEDITGKNAQRISRFWASLIFDTEIRKRITILWTSHLTCTLTYIETLQKTGNPKGAEFQDAVKDCLAKGGKFGQAVNDGLPRSY